MEALKEAGSLQWRSLSSKTNKNNARVLREFLSIITKAIYRQDLNELRIINIIGDNSIVTKINNIFTPSYKRKYWSK